MVPASAAVVDVPDRDQRLERVGTRSRSRRRHTYRSATPRASDALTPSTPVRSKTVDAFGARHRDLCAVGAPDRYDDPRAVRRDRSRTEWPFARTRPTPTAPSRRSARGSPTPLCSRRQPTRLARTPCRDRTARLRTEPRRPARSSGPRRSPCSMSSPAIASRRPSRGQRHACGPLGEITADSDAVPSSRVQRDLDRRHDGRAFADRVVAGERRPPRPPACERARGERRRRRPPATRRPRGGRRRAATTVSSTAVGRRRGPTSRSSRR